MVVRTVPIGTSRRARERVRRSALLSLAFRQGNVKAAWRLITRGRAYRSLSVGMPWRERLALAAIGRDKYNARRRLEKERAAVQERLQRELEQTR